MHAVAEQVHDSLNAGHDARHVASRGHRQFDSDRVAEDDRRPPSPVFAAARIGVRPEYTSPARLVDTQFQALGPGQIGQLKAQLADYQVIKEQAQAAAAQVSQTQKTIDDLQALAKRAEERIGSIPREVIRQIVDILQAALQ